MNLRSLFSAAAVVASLVVPSIANAQKIPNAAPAQVHSAYTQRRAPAFGRGQQAHQRGPDAQRTIEARRNEEMRRAQIARGAERAEEGRRGEGERHGNGAPASCEHGRGGERGQSVGPQRGLGRNEQGGPQRESGRGGHH